MISISKLYCGGKAWGDRIRYGTDVGRHIKTHPTVETPTSAHERKPVVVWNITQRCNLRCLHCYSDSENRPYPDELTTREGEVLLDDLAEFGVPVVLFSGGEPLMRPDIMQLLDHARRPGLRTVLSTNGTLIDDSVAQELKKRGVAYVGISLDGIGKTNDAFRGVEGAFEKAVQGIESCARAGVKVGLRLTLTRHTVSELDAVFEFVHDSPVERVCFYHLVYTGRGRGLTGDELIYAETRAAIDKIIDGTARLDSRGYPGEILTVDNHVDGVYLYLRMKHEAGENPEKIQRARSVLELLRWNGGGLNSTGIGIGAVDARGNVHPDQFWTHYSPGSVRERPFSEIWQDERDPILRGLRHRSDLIKGRCRLCHWFDACGGSLRVRADVVYNDPWAPDPGCYLSDEEIGLDSAKQNELTNNNEIFPIPEFYMKKDT